MSLYVEAFGMARRETDGLDEAHLFRAHYTLAPQVLGKTSQKWLNGAWGVFLENPNKFRGLLIRS